MPETSHAPGWGIQLAGHAADLAMWSAAMAPPFEPWIEIVSGGGPEVHVLRSSGLNGAADAEQAYSMGRPLVERLNGVLGIVGAEEPIRAGSLVEFGAGGEISAHVFAEVRTGRLRGITGTIIAEVVDDDGQSVPPSSPQPSDAQRWDSAAERDDDLAALLTYFSRSDGDWYEIYKTIEVGKRVARGKANFEKLLGSHAQAVELMRTTANYYRHAQGATHQPASLMSLAQTWPLLRLVVQAVLDAAVPK